jgi:integrase
MPRRNQGPRLRWLTKRECFYITWSEHGRSRERSTGTADRTQAEITFAEWLQRRGHRQGPRDPATILVTDVLNEYATERGPKVTAPEVMGRAIEAQTPFWEGRLVGEVTPQACARYCEWRRRSNGTMRRELGVLQAAINWAHKNGRLTRSVHVALPECPEPRSRWLTRQEAARLIRAARTQKARLYLPLFILLGLYTGRRKEAILSLRWPQVDLAAGLIDFDVGGRARTKKRRGTVRIPARLRPHLQRAWRRGTDMGYVVHINGQAIQNLKKGFGAACVRAGLEGVTPHVLRHTAATWLMQAGVALWEAAGFLSMRPETLQRVYGHHHPDFMREAANAIGRRPRNVRVIA